MGPGYELDELDFADVYVMTFKTDEWPYERAYDGNFTEEEARGLNNSLWR